MFRPNLDCVLSRSSGKTDVYGQPLPATKVKERCAVITMNLKNEKSSVRADSSASRGAARELQADALILMGRNSKVAIDDVVEVEGIKIRVVGKFPRRNLNGQLDHYEVAGTYWSEK